MKLKLALIAATMGLVPVLANAAENTVNSRVKNGGNTAMVVQSGDPGSAKVRIDQRPGYTRIEQHSGTNSATVIQMDATPGAR